MPVMKGETRNSYPFETKMSAVKAHVEDGMTSAEAMKAYDVEFVPIVGEATDSGSYLIEK